MNEIHLLALKHGVKNVDVQVDSDNVSSDNRYEAVTVTVTFSVTTQHEAWIAVHGDGTISPAFGGTGTVDRELAEYVTHAIEIYRAITDDRATGFDRPTDHRKIEPKPADE